MLLEKATLPNYWVRRGFNSLVRPSQQAHLHLGCGPKYIKGFINIDANPLTKTDIWLDVRCGIPFPDGSVASIYSTHMLEHLYPDELERLLRECLRVLKPDGGVRFIVPNLRSAILAYQQNRTDWFDSFPRTYSSLGGRFSNFIFCDGQHRGGLDFDHLAEVLHKVGFRSIEESREGASRLFGEHVPPFAPGDGVELPHSVYVEAFK